MNTVFSLAAAISYTKLLSRDANTLVNLGRRAKRRAQFRHIEDEASSIRMLSAWSKLNFPLPALSGEAAFGSVELSYIQRGVSEL